MKFSLSSLMRNALLSTVMLILAACGGGSGGGVAATGVFTFTIGGTVSGLAGTVVLQDNNGDDLAITKDGAFTFATPVASPNTYSVTVFSQPAGQTCSVSSGTGTVSASNVSNVTVICSANAYTVGGSVSGLTGTVVLQDNNGDDLALSANDTFTFTTPVAYNSTYKVTVLTQPTGQTCSVSSGVGSVSTSNVSNVVVVCSANAYTVGGTIAGLSGFMVLQDNNGDNLVVAANGTFTFATSVAYGSPYSVTILTQPTGQTCAVSAGSGLISNGNVNNVSVACTTNTYTIGGAVSGLTGTVVLQDNNGDNLTLSTNSTFTFATKVAYGSPYNVTVLTQPAGQTCSVSSGSSNYATGNVSNVSVVCSANAYTVGGTITGLAGTMVLQDNNGDNLVVAASGTFTFATPVAYNSSYSVTVLTRPATQNCSVTNGSGTMGAANVTNVVVTCINVTQMGGAMQGIPLNLAPTVSTIATGFSNPNGITTDGTNLYVADTGNNKIRKIVIATGLVTTLAGTGTAGAADGSGATAMFNSPYGITTDGTNLYVSDWFNNKIRKIVIATGVVSSLTGVANTTSAGGATDGAGASATFADPKGITTDGTNLYVVDQSNNKIRKIVISTGVVSSLTGTANTAMPGGAIDGSGAAATFRIPHGITTDGANLYVTDMFNNKIRKIVIATGVVSSLTGTASTAQATGVADGTGTTAGFYFPEGITTDGTNLYVADNGNSKIRKIVIATGVVSSLTGTANTVSALGATDGAGATATFNVPYGITADGVNLYVADYINNTIRKIQ